MKYVTEFLRNQMKKMNMATRNNNIKLHSNNFKNINQKTLHSWKRLLITENNTIWISKTMRTKLMSF